MSDLIIGKRPVLEALKAKVPIKRICIADNLERDSLIKDILRKAKQQDVKVEDVSRKRLEEILESSKRPQDPMKDRSDTAQGVIAQAYPYQYFPLKELIEDSVQYARNHDGRALLVICDHLTDSGNLGAIARSAESVGASGMIIPNKRSAHVTPSTYKSSAGAISHIKVAEVSNIAATIEKLKDEGFWIIGATEHSEQTLWKSNLEGKIAIVMGNEQNGISRLVLENCDIICHIPMEGIISSLNVAQASTVFMYEWLRQNVD